MTSPWPRSEPNAAHLEAFADAVVRSVWLDHLPSRDPHPRLEGEAMCDLCIVGGGYTGLWAALHAIGEQPQRSVVVLESGRCGEGVSGRNGGFLASSLTHGLANGLSRFADEMPALERLGIENFTALRDDLDRLGIDAEYELSGGLRVALAPHELQGPEEDAELMRRFGYEAEVLTAMRSARRSTRRPISAACGLTTIPHSCIRASWPKGCGARRPMPAFRSTSTVGPRGSRQTATVCASCPTRERCGPRGRRWPPAPTRRCSGRSVATSHPSTTTS